jgi:hypothetical protein
MEVVLGSNEGRTTYEALFEDANAERIRKRKNEEQGKEDQEG